MRKEFCLLHSISGCQQQMTISGWIAASIYERVGCCFMESPEKDPGKIAQANKSSVISGILSQGHQNQTSTSVRKAFNNFFLQRTIFVQEGQRLPQTCLWRCCVGLGGRETISPALERTPAYLRTQVADSRITDSPQFLVNSENCDFACSILANLKTLF